MGKIDVFVRIPRRCTRVSRGYVGTTETGRVVKLSVERTVTLKRRMLKSERDRRRVDMVEDLDRLGGSRWGQSVGRAVGVSIRGGFC